MSGGKTRLGSCNGCELDLRMVDGVWCECHEDSPGWPWSKVWTLWNSLKMTASSWISRMVSFTTVSSFPKQEVGLLHFLLLHVELKLAKFHLNLRVLCKAICENLHASYWMFFNEVFCVCFTICHSLTQDQLTWVSTQLLYIHLPFKHDEDN